jgi:prepilin peptidase CpaA
MSLLALLQTGCLLAFAVLLVAAGWQDWRTLRIANSLPLATVGLYTMWASAGMAMSQLSGSTIGFAIATALIVFTIGAAGFAGGLLGGGDVKLLAAASLFAGPGHILDFLTLTAIAGGALGVALLAGAKIGPAALPENIRARLRVGLPYGPAIAAGGLWVAAALAVS